MSILQSFIAGQEARRQADAAAEINRMQQFLGQNGQAIFQGDQNALGQLAGMGAQGLETAMGLRNAQEERAARQAAQERETVLQGREDQTWKLKLEERAASLDAATREAERAQLAEGLAGAAYFHAQGDEQGYTAFLQQNGIDPAQFPFEAFPAHAAKFKEVLEVYDRFKPEVADPTDGAPSGYKWAEPGNPGAGVVPLPGFERSSGVTINTGESGPRVGTIPQGFAAVEDPASPAGVRLVPIPGGPEDTAGADAASAASTARTADVVLEDIGRLRELVKGAPVYSPAAGFGAQRLAEFGGTNAADAAALAETIGANIGFDRLQAMREASPTGGALGNVTERELQALRSVLGSIELSQSPQQLVENLDRLEKMYQDIMAKAAAYPNAAQFGFEGGPAPSATPGELSDDDLLKMYGG